MAFLRNAHIRMQTLHPLSRCVSGNDCPLSRPRHSGGRNGTYVFEERTVPSMGCHSGSKNCRLRFPRRGPCYAIDVLEQGALNGNVYDDAPTERGGRCRHALREPAARAFQCSTTPYNPNEPFIIQTTTAKERRG